MKSFDGAEGFLDVRDKLMIAIRPTRLDVINASDVHAGHWSAPGTKPFRRARDDARVSRQVAGRLPPAVVDLADLKRHLLEGS
jgi:hypothetical protein